MDGKGIDNIQELKIREALALDKGKKAGAKSRINDFDALLEKVAGEVEALKGDADHAVLRRAPEGIQDSETLREALQEAGRNFRSAMKLGKNLVEAYKTTIAAVSKEKG